ncbi:hypothetical protein IWQ49_003923 [Labrenzia sp. EL_126]|nr:hypothetical protein [Labrenzia sp. EL_126]
MFDFIAPLGRPAVSGEAEAIAIGVSCIGAGRKTDKLATVTVIGQLVFSIGCSLFRGVFFDLANFEDAIPIGVSRTNIPLVTFFDQQIDTDCFALAGNTSGAFNTFAVYKNGACLIVRIGDKEIVSVLPDQNCSCVGIGLSF